MNPWESHPNASRAVGGGSGGILVSWLLGHFHIAISAEDGAIIATAVAGVWVFIGRDGLAGAWRRLLHGNTPPAGP